MWQTERSTARIIRDGVIFGNHASCATIVRVSDNCSIEEKCLKPGEQLFLSSEISGLECRTGLALNPINEY